MSKSATLAVVAAGFAARLAVPYALPWITNTLDQSVLFSTPINSYRSLQEALFLANSQMNPFKEGEIAHHPPLVLELFRVLHSTGYTTLFFALIDTLFGLQLLKLNTALSHNAKGSSNGDSDYFPPLLIALFYSFNPLALLTTFAKSTSILNNLAVVSALNSLIADPFGPTVAVFLAVSTYLTYYSWYFMVPVLYYTVRKTGAAAQAAKQVVAFLGTLAALLGASYLLTGSANFIGLCYGSIVLFKKITPNLGLWWYFFTEMFGFFYRFYLGVFNIYSFIFVVPVTMRFISQPTCTVTDALFVHWCLIGMLNFSRAYPTITDLNLYFSLTVLFKPLYKKLKFPPAVATLSLFIILLLLPIFYYVWMGLNSGNANFFYAIGLVYTMIEVVVISDFLWSKLQLEYYALKKVSLEKTLKLTQI